LSPGQGCRKRETWMTLQENRVVFCVLGKKKKREQGGDKEEEKKGGGGPDPGEMELQKLQGKTKVPEALQVGRGRRIDGESTETRAEVFPRGGGFVSGQGQGKKKAGSAQTLSKNARQWGKRSNVSGGGQAPTCGQSGRKTKPQGPLSTLPPKHRIFLHGLLPKNPSSSARAWPIRRV